MHKVKASRAMPDTYSTCKSTEDCFKSDAWPDFPCASGKENFPSEDITPLFYRNDTEHSAQTLIPEMENDEDTIARLHNHKDASKNRMSWLNSKENRKKLKITPSDVITTDFANGYVCMLSF